MEKNGIGGQKKMAVYTKKKTEDEALNAAAEATSAYKQPTYGGNALGTEAGRYYQKLRETEEGFDNPYSDDIDALMERINGTPEYSYDANADPLYQTIRDKAVRDGKMAARDTTAQMSNLTGGYGNSYAASAGNQAYQEYLRSATEQIPTLESNARSAYYDNLDEQLNQLNMLLGMTDTELSAWQTERAYNQGAYQDALSAESNYWGGGSGSGSGSGGSGSASIAKTENYSDYEKQQAKTNEIAYNAEGMANDREKLSKYLSASVSNGEIDADTAKQIFNKFYNGEVNIKSDTYDTYNSKSATGKDEPYKTTQSAVSSKLASSSAPESTKVSAYNSIVTYLNQRFKLGYITSSQRKFLLEEAADKMSLSV
jgi:hypothetical protein